MEIRQAIHPAILGLILLGSSAAAQQKYCSSQNTGADFQGVYDIYQSNGACYDQCKSAYAFAIVQYKNCWCSNYIPADQQSTGDCSQECPGYPEELCGNQSEDLYGYIALPNPPAGTMGGSSSQPESTSPPESQTSQPPPASTYAPPPQSSDTQDPSTTPQSTQAPPPSSTSSVYSSSSSSTSSSRTKSAVTSTRVTTIHGSVVTQTVTSTPIIIGDGESNNQPMMTSKGLTGGAIAAIVIGTLVAVAALLAAAFFLWRRKRKSDAEAEGGPKTRPKRSTSVLSKTGLLSRARPQSMSENNYEDSYSANPTTQPESVRHSMMFGASMAEGVSPSSPLGSSADVSSSRRHSKPLVYDQRLNPSALFANFDNGSRVSMQDQQDYSRPLGIANPDYRSSFDSR